MAESDTNKLPLLASQFLRAVRQFEAYAKEPLKVVFQNHAFWMFGSEQGATRLADVYRGCRPELASHGYNAQLGAHYFMLVTPHFTGYRENDAYRVWMQGNNMNLVDNDAAATERDETAVVARPRMKA